MTRAQWSAVYNYCADFGYTPQELLAELKSNGTVDRDTELPGLGAYVKGKNYEEMYQFLGDNL